MDHIDADFADSLTKYSISPGSMVIFSTDGFELFCTLFALNVFSDRVYDLFYTFLVPFFREFEGVYDVKVV